MNEYVQHDTAHGARYFSELEISLRRSEIYTSFKTALRVYHLSETWIWLIVGIFGFSINRRNKTCLRLSTCKFALIRCTSMFLHRAFVMFWCHSHIQLGVIVVHDTMNVSMGRDERPRSTDQCTGWTPMVLRQTPEDHPMEGKMVWK